jgi:AraC-like DNA-binding protein
VAQLCPHHLAINEDRGRQIYWDNSNRLGRNESAYCLLQLTLEGKGFFRAEGRTEELTPGRMFLVPVPSPTIYRAGEGVPWKWIFVSFRGEMAFPLVRRINKTRGYLIEQPPEGFVARTLLDWHHRLDSADPPGHNELSAGLYRLLLDLLSEGREQFSATQERMARASRLIDEHFAEPTFTVVHLATALGMSVSHFSRTYQRETGRSPGDALRMRRLEEARDLLTAGNYSVKEVAYAAGYSSPISFSSAFRQEFGRSPRQFRQEVLPRG